MPSGPVGRGFIWHLDTQRLYAGTYFLHFSNGKNSIVKQVALVRE